MIIWSDNDKIDKSKIDLIVSDLKKNKKCFDSNSRFYSSYFCPFEERPEKCLHDYYSCFLERLLKDLTLHQRTKCMCSSWIQVYYKGGGTIGPHVHFSGNEFLSWAHFIRPSSKKCFYFLKHDGEKMYPKQQNEGDFIVFPSWALHGVDCNQDDNDRVVMSGNVMVQSIRSPMSPVNEHVSNAHVIHDRLTVWESNLQKNLKKGFG